jgi:hypothetical protein
MSLKTISFLAIPILFSTSLLAQNTTPANPSGPTRMGRGGEPCWQQAGIDKSVMEQRWALEKDTRTQVEAVCSNSSLTPQQKQEQAREIRRQSKQKIEGMVTPDQEKALTACQQQRGMNHPGMNGGGMNGGGTNGGAHEGGAGREAGCGEWPHNGTRPNGTSGTSGNGTPPPPSLPPQN